MAKNKRPAANKASSSAPKKKQSSAIPNRFRPWLTHLGIIAAFTALLFVYFSPVMSGKAIKQSDIGQFQSMSKEVKDFHEETGEWSAWSNSQFGGMPTYQMGIQYPNNLFKKILRFLLFGLPAPIQFLFLMFVGYYFLLSTFRIDPLISALGAFAFTFSSYFFIIMPAGHTSKALAISYMAPIVAGVLTAYRGKVLLGSIIAAIALTLQITANHLQITYYLALTLVILGIAFGIDAILKKTVKDFAIASGALLLAAGMAVGPSASLLWTTNEYAKETIRGNPTLSSNDDGTKAEGGLGLEYALRWSYGKMETFTLMIPNFQGGASGTHISTDSDAYRQLQTKVLPTYWGSQPFTEGPVYVGAIICFLFVLGLALVEGPIMWWLVGATLLSIMLSWGRFFPGLTEFFFAYVPLYDKFRAPAMMLVVAEFTMPLLGMLGLYRLIRYKEEGISHKHALKSLYLAAGITGGIALFWALLGPSFLDFSSPSDSRISENPRVLDIIRDYRVSMFTGDAWRAFGLIGVSTGLLVLFLRNSLKPTIVIGALLALSLIDMWSVNKRYLNDDDFQPKRIALTPQKTAVDNFILKEQDPNYRVLHFHEGDISKTFNSSATSYYHKNVGGYHAAKLRRYQDVISRNIQPEMIDILNVLRTTSTGIDSVLKQTIASKSFINMMNTKFLIFSDKQAPFRNDAALGNAWLVSDVQWVKGADEEIAAIKNFDPSRKAVIDEQFKSQLEGFTPQSSAGSSIRLTDYKPNHLTYEVNASSDQLAIFSEVYYNSGKGWNAYIKGEKVPHFRANYILRGMKLPAGQYTVEFKMEPKSYQTGETIALIFSILLLLAAAGIGYWEWKKGKENQNES